MPDRIKYMNPPPGAPPIQATKAKPRYAALASQQSNNATVILLSFDNLDNPTMDPLTLSLNMEHATLLRDLLTNLIQIEKSQRENAN